MPQTPSTARTTSSTSTSATRWTGEFIPVPDAIARGTTPGSSAGRARELVEREQCLPVHPGRGHRLRPGQPARRLLRGHRQSPAQGRTERLADAEHERPALPVLRHQWAVFKMVSTPTIRRRSTRSPSMPRVACSGRMPARRPSSRWFRPASASEPDNLDAGHASLMVQEDTANAKIWRNDFARVTLDARRHGDPPNAAPVGR